jgi:long-subunit acyl-CoA synthetase (AMP-forming)
MRPHPADWTDLREWEVVTWAEYLLAARRIAGGLAELVEPGQRVATPSENRVEWHLAI